VTHYVVFDLEIVPDLSVTRRLLGEPEESLAEALDRQAKLRPSLSQ
jgi:hypothetical protein